MYALITVKYASIRQVTVLERLKTLTRAPCKSQMGANAWPSYMKINLESMEVFKQIEEWARFWNVFGTLFFTSYILKLGYEAYTSLFLHKSFNAAQLAGYLFFPLYHVVSLLLYTQLCASIVARNGQIVAVQRKIYWKLSEHLGGKGQFARMLKVQGMAHECRLKPYSFTIFSSHRLTFMSINEVRRVSE